MFTSSSAFCRTEGEKPQAVNVENPEVTFIPDRITENHANDSDSDGPILYKDDEDEDEDDEYTSSTCTCLLCVIARPLFFCLSVKAFKKKLY